MVFAIARLYAPIHQFIDDGNVECEMLHEFLCQMITEHTPRNTHKVSKGLSDDKKTNCDGLFRWMQLRSVKGKRFDATGIISAQGVAPISSEERVSKLVAHWSPIFAQNHGDSELASKFVCFCATHPSMMNGF
jgi:hypothetical protein